MTSILLILMAWIVKMPLWLSITITVCSSVRFLVKLLLYFAKVGQSLSKD